VTAYLRVSFENGAVSSGHEGAGAEALSPF
jgi:hypothetical protein